ncbi:hypothetical protein COCSADRAFT_252036 [Bipolaris sorokiniana ND90Pr]|uniref:Uncharacterized protein n=1 Tax=Cochliobolus sativus (strain ND90Pr / ATCC 201652) TaxID=665912 RepID=M2QX49_COCSN|nr:uncharacterized protein COCSADRAFT_252036 [Bipolaris sorokiniana ND90Pr]EMD59629.1 hypothetical protein COCSADRAFT_252036 [Bipolaris sorokiniana ND90Pr]
MLPESAPVPVLSLLYTPAPMNDCWRASPSPCVLVVYCQPINLPATMCMATPTTRRGRLPANRSLAHVFPPPALQRLAKSQTFRPSSLRIPTQPLSRCLYP